MKVVFDYQIFGMQTYGGVSRYAYELAMELTTSQAQDVTVVSPLYVNRYLANAPSELDVMGVQVPKIPRVSRVYRVLNSLLSRRAMIKIRPDIVHETYFSAKRIAPITAKVVLTVYDMIHERFSNYYSSSDPTSRVKLLAVKRADHIICISEKTRQDLIELQNVDPTKTSVVHLGFSQTCHDIAHRDHGIPLRPFLLYVGSRAKYKNFGRLLRAYACSTALIKSCDLICFGGGTFTKRERSMFDQLKLSAERVKHVSGGDADLFRYYRSATAFVCPSLYEGFGLPPLEAMSCGCPVICGAVGSIPEVVGDAGEMFDPYDVDSIRLSLERVVYDATLRQRLIAFGRKRIKLFSWKRCAQETLAIYQKVLS